ncbi:hypothetical protein OTU49_002452 [Cherax quadricarinatus]|uniref:omega-amidase n=1 Tax=Cherax quadricarinatus TaxID=27406 RepID=A0AAW0XAU6_CHEQU
MASKLRLALIQMSVGDNKAKNIARAVQLIREAAGGGAQLVALPECFNSPYGTNYFHQYAETIPGESTEALSTVAKKFGLYIVGGSIPERDEDKVYNTCTVWGPQGDMIAKYRKIYIGTISPARDTSAKYIAWGHSSVINPWGEVIATSEEYEAIIYGDVDLDYVEKVRQMIPLRDQRRNDLYEINIK